MRYVFATLLVAFLFLGGYLFFYLGVYKSAEVHGLEQKTFYLLFKDHSGPYHQISASLAEVELWASEQRITCAKTFGLFLDDPEKVEPDRLRSQVGCVLEDGDEIPFSNTYKVRRLSEAPYLHMSFSGSPSIGPMKVYSRVDDWLRENRYRLVGPVLEIYSIPNKNQIHTDYFFPLGQ